jgi:transposase
LRDWVREDDMVHFVISAVEGMDISAFRVNVRGTGSDQYPPRMMLGLLIYCYASGVFGSRRIETATYQNVSVRYLTGDTHPDHDTIAKFRRENLPAVHQCFVRVLELGGMLKLLKIGTVSVDGTHVRANASKNRNVTYDRAGELLQELKQEVSALLQQAETADRRDDQDGQRLPQELARREALQAKMEKVRGELEERAKRRAASEQADYERKMAARKERQGNRKGPRIKPPKDTPGGDEQGNMVDGDSRLMRKNKRSGYEQCYSAQAVVDAEGSQLVLAARVSQCASDRNELVEDIRAIPEKAGSPKKILADSGYACEEQIKSVQADGMEVFVATGAERARERRRHDFRPAHCRSETRKEPKAEWLVAMKEKLETEEGRRLYGLRKQTVEPVFGIIKQCMGFRQFLLRGLEKVSGEWELVTLAYNVKRLWNLKLAHS